MGLTSDLDNQYTDFYGIRVDFVDGQESPEHVTVEWIKDGELQLDAEEFCTKMHGNNRTGCSVATGLLLVQMQINVSTQVIEFEIKLPGDHYDHTSSYLRDLKKFDLCKMAKQQDIWRMTIDNNSINNQGPFFEVRMIQYEMITK